MLTPHRTRLAYHFTTHQTGTIWHRRSLTPPVLRKTRAAAETQMQSEMQWAAFVKAENGNVTVQKPDFLNTFNVRALEKLKTDIVPTPDENLFVIVKGNTFPLKDLLKEVVSPVKMENVGGSGFNGYEIQKKNLDKAIEIMEYWGLMVTLYDEVVA